MLLNIRLVRINLVSGLAQIVQIGTITPLLAFRLSEAGADSWVIGLVVSASWIAVLVASHSLPKILSKIGVVKAIGIGLVLTVVSLALMEISASHIALFLANFIAGIGLILRWVACDTWIVQAADERERGRAIGVHETLMGLGIALGPMVLGVTGFDGQSPFLACIGIMLLSLLVLFMARADDFLANIHSKSSLLPTLKLIPVAIVGAFSAGFVETSVLSFLSVHLIDISYAPRLAAMVLAAYGLGGTLFQLPMGWVADTIGFRGAQTLSIVVSIIGSLGVAAFSGFWSLTIAIAFIWGGAVGAMNTLAVIEAGHTATESQMSSSMAGIAFAYTLGSVVGPIVSGTVNGYVGTNGMLFATAALCIAISVGFMFRKDAFIRT